MHNLIKSSAIILFVLLLSGCCTFKSAPGMGNVTRGIAFSSQHVGNQKFTLYLPPEYTSEPQISYPVLYLLHGGFSNHCQYVCKVGLSQIIEDLRTSGDLGPMIVVMPDGGWGSWWVNREDGNLPFADYIMDELIPYIDATYRTLNSQEHRGIGGISMGGFGAMSLSFRNPDQFDVVATTSAALAADLPTAQSSSIFWYAGTFGIPLSVGYYEARDPVTLARHTSMTNLEDLAIRFDVGLSDDAHAGNEVLHQALLARQIPHVAEFDAGEHNLDYFTDHTDELLRFVWDHIGTTP